MADGYISAPGRQVLGGQRQIHAPFQIHSIIFVGLQARESIRRGALRLQRTPSGPLLNDIALLLLFKASESNVAELFWDYVANKQISTDFLTSEELRLGLPPAMGPSPNCVFFVGGSHVGSYYLGVYKRLPSLRPLPRCLALIFEAAWETGRSWKALMPNMHFDIYIGLCVCVSVCMDVCMWALARTCWVRGGASGFLVRSSLWAAFDAQSTVCDLIYVDEINNNQPQPASHPQTDAQYWQQPIRKRKRLLGILLLRSDGRAVLSNSIPASCHVLEGSGPKGRLHRVYTGIMEKKMETTTMGLYRDYIGIKKI